VPTISVSRPYSGEELVKFLDAHGYRYVRQRGSHAVLVYEDPNTGEKRRVTVPMHDEIKTGTLRNIAEQCGANDFREFLDWLDSGI